MRERVLEDRTESSTRCSGFYHDASIPIDTSCVTRPVAHYVNKMLDIVTPEFEKLKNTGNIILSPMYKEVSWAENPILGIHADMQGNYQLGYHVYGLLVMDCSPLTYNRTIQYEPCVASIIESGDEVEMYFAHAYGEFRDKAITQAWANIDQSEIQALASLGELPETIAWLANVFRRFIKITSAFKGKAVKKQLVKYLGKKGKANRISADIADIWLEWRYAIRPLMFEAEQLVKAMGKTLDETTRFTARGTSKKTSTDSSEVYIPHPHHAGLGAVFQVLTQVEYSARAGCIYTCTPPTSEFLTIFGLDQPVSSLWELVPYSFIVDWFFNVGDFVASWELQSSMSVLGSWVTEVETVTQTSTLVSIVEPWTAAGYTNLVTSTDNTVSKGVRQLKCRSINPSKPILPSFNLRLDGYKIADLVAIARSVYGNR